MANLENPIWNLLERDLSINFGLLEEIADINSIPRRNGKTMLHAACEQGDVCATLVEYLCKRGMWLEDTTGRGDTPLELACGMSENCGFPSLRNVLTLLHYGANKSWRGPGTVSCLERVNYELKHAKGIRDFGIGANVNNIVRIYILERILEALIA